jgi:hypothetical protein
MSNYIVSLDGLQRVDNDADSKPVEFLYYEPPQPEAAYIVNRRERRDGKTNNTISFFPLDVVVASYSLAPLDAVPAHLSVSEQTLRDRRVLDARVALAKRRDKLAVKHKLRVAAALAARLKRQKRKRGV